MEKNGFTLMEVLFATVIMVSVLIALVYSLTQAANVTQTVHNQDIALSAAQDMLEEIANSDLNQIMNYNGQTFAVETEVVAADGTTTTIPLLHAPPGLNALGHPGSITVAQIGTTNLYNVTVTVTWQQAGGRVLNRSLSTTLVNK